MVATRDNNRNGRGVRRVGCVAGCGIGALVVGRGYVTRSQLELIPVFRAWVRRCIGVVRVRRTVSGTGYSGSGKVLRLTVCDIV